MCYVPPFAALCCFAHIVPDRVAPYRGVACVLSSAVLCLVVLHIVLRQNMAPHYQAIDITFDHVPHGHAAAITPTVWLRRSCNADCVAACLQEEFAGCCSQACLEAPRLLRPPKQAGYYGNWTTYRYQLDAVSVTVSW